MNSNVCLLLILALAAGCSVTTGGNTFESNRATPQPIYNDSVRFSGLGRSENWRSADGYKVDDFYCALPNRVMLCASQGGAQLICRCQRT